MNNPITLHTMIEQPMKRVDLVRLANIALQTGETHYARMLAIAWLGVYPGDLPVNMILARAMEKEGLLRQALPILDNLCQLDPEYLNAQELLAEIRGQLGLATAGEADASILALGGAPKNRKAVPKWASLLRASRRRMGVDQGGSITRYENKRAQTERAQYLIHQALLENPTNPLAAVTHLKHMRQSEVMKASVANLAQVYRQRWPRCLLFTLVLAEYLADTGQSEPAVSLLHQAASMDVTGQVASSLWGDQNPFDDLWPKDLEVLPESPSAPQRIPIPAPVVAVLGWNQLPTVSTLPLPPEFIHQSSADSAHQSHVGHLSELKKPLAFSGALKNIQESLEKTALKVNQPELAQLDGRYPIYVIFSSRQGLENQYGIEGADQIDSSMRRLLAAIASRKTWGALLYYPDAPQLSSRKFAQSLIPVSPRDPWALKLSLVDLDAALAEQGEMIAAVLIVGGSNIIPFHRLPNPIDDDDPEVLSDNPYATRDENFFIPEWPVGRLPGGSGLDPAMLLSTLQSISRHHASQVHNPAWHKRWWKIVQKTLTSLGFNRNPRAPSFGYSAAIWRRASLSVFRPIGEPRFLQVSPPHSAAADCRNNDSLKPCIKLPGARLGYFNLHGLPDAYEWYGQRDPSEPGEGPDFPMALRPEDIYSNSSSQVTIPEIVFSEACYGAHIQNRTVEQAISLKFLQAGSLAVVGSTCISYGSISTPLIAADLLGRTFWQYVNEGHPAGEALRRAKIFLAREMDKRQGYLDGEDQKTLISFVLYGDPMAQAGINGHSSKSSSRLTDPPAPVCTVCDRVETTGDAQAMPGEVLAQVKSIVAQYLPGMAGARLAYAHERSSCRSTAHLCPTAQFGPKVLQTSHPDRQVITLSKQVTQAKLVHRQYARITLDAQGKLVKLVVSR